MASSSTSHSPAEIVKALLIGLGQVVEANTYGEWKAFVGQQPDAPDDLVFIHPLTGLKVGRHQVSGQVQVRPSVELVVRAIRGTGTAGHTRAWDKANQVCIALDEQVLNTTVTIGSYTYIVHAASRIGEINSEGQDPTNRERHICSVTYDFSMTQL